MGKITNPKPGTGENYQPQPQTKISETKSEVSPETPSQAPQAGNQLITLTQDQFDTLLGRLGSGTADKAPAPSMTPGVGLQTNRQGQVIGTVTKFNIDPEYYPNPIERLAQEPRLSRFAFDENYFLTWDISSKPYETKDGISTQEPTFHATLYMNMYDEDGEDTGKAIVIQTLHYNEDEQEAFRYAAELGLQATHENMREIMDRARYERAKRWLLAIFFPEKSFGPSNDSHEEPIGGTVVKIVTKSNVKGFGNPTPKIREEELQ